MNQSRKDALTETFVNISIGSVIAWVITYVIMVNVKNPAIASMLSVACCTVASFIRGYWVRRHFNYLCNKKPDVN